jgi:hypothetical protein|tara:strand:- start:429 stop:632 length:204 start_codon:yes stop_codon:yes gene_type:complete
MKGIFAIRDKGHILQFSDYDDIPQSFENLIRFEPVPPPTPHTEKEHKEMHSYNEKLQELMKRETNER